MLPWYPRGFLLAARFPCYAADINNFILMLILILIFAENEIKQTLWDQGSRMSFLTVTFTTNSKTT